MEQLSNTKLDLWDVDLIRSTGVIITDILSAVRLNSLKTLMAFSTQRGLKKLHHVDMSEPVAMVRLARQWPSQFRAQAHLGVVFLPSKVSLDRLANS